MPLVIRMTAAQAANVGDDPSQPKPQMLVPNATTDPDTFYVGADAIDCAAFADRADQLRSFPQVDYDTVIRPLLPQPGNV